MHKNLKIFLLILSLVLSLSFISCTKTEVKQSYDGREYDLSINQDKSVIATTVKVGSKYTLTFKGSGEGMDFKSKNEVPWNPIVKSIDKIIIEDGVTKIGSYYFYSSNIDEFYLPSSLKTISSNAFLESAVLYSYTNEDINTTISNKIYYYSEVCPSMPNKYFHIVEGVPVIWASYKVLFIGNSFTYYTNQADNPLVPYFFKEIALSLGESVEIDFVIKGSHTLTKFSNPDDEMGKIVYEKLNGANNYTHVVLQEQSTAPINSFNSFKTAVGILKDLVDKTQTDCKVVLYETWGSPTGIQSTSYKTVGEMEIALKNAYDSVAKEYGLSVDYVGKAFTYVYETLGINVYFDDNRHQNNVGAYLSACVHVASIIKADVRTSTYYDSIDNEVCKKMQDVAYSIAFNLELSNNNASEKEDDAEHLLVVAWYQKEATSGLNEAIMNKFLDDLKEYLKTLNYSSEEINSVIIRGYSGNVLPSCEAIKNDNDVDIMVGWKSNVDTTGNLTFIESYPKTAEESGIQMGEVNDRWIHRLTDTELSKSVFNWIVSNKDNLFK